MQDPILFGNGSEDCLTVSVYTRNLQPDAKGLRPVIVFLHGGNLMFGGHTFGQSSALLAWSNEVVVVTVQYRLGVFGFLALQELAEHDPRGRVGNYGLLDSQEALRWVQQNIQGFGGDPGRVTVLGQSSGGSLIMAMLASSNSQGLFQSAWISSASVRVNSTTQEASSYWHRPVPLSTRCAAAEGAGLGECLLGLSAQEVLEAQPMNWNCNGFQTISSIARQATDCIPLLLVDGELLPSSLLDGLLVDGRLLDVPLVIGDVPADIGFVQSPAEVGSATHLESELWSLEPSFGRAFVLRALADYGFDGPSPVDAYFTNARVLSDVSYSCGILYVAAAMEATRLEGGRKAPIYYYMANVSTIPVFGEDLVVHGSDIAGATVTMAKKHGWGLRLQQKIFNFAATGAVDSWSPVVSSHTSLIKRRGLRLRRSRRSRRARVPRQLPSSYTGMLLEEDGDHKVEGLLRDRCNLWLGAGSYDTMSIIN